MIHCWVLLSFHPVAQISKHLLNEQTRAALKIQAIWKGYRSRKGLETKKCTVKRIRAAIKIQRVVRLRCSWIYSKVSSKILMTESLPEHSKHIPQLYRVISVQFLKLYFILVPHLQGSVSNASKTHFSFFRLANKLHYGGNCKNILNFSKILKNLKVKCQTSSHFSNWLSF